MKKVLRNIGRVIALASLTAFSSCSEVFDSTWKASSTERSLLLSNSSLSFTSEAQSKTVSVQAENMPWAFMNNAMWLTFSPSSGNSSAAVKASVSENRTDTARTSYVLLKSADTDFPSSYNLTVSQSAPATFIEFSEDNLIFDGCASEQRVTVSCNRTWTYSATESWISISRSDNSLIISVSVNDSNSAREGYVHVAAGNTNKHILITQRAADITCTLTALHLGMESTTKSIDITSDAPWIASCDLAWIDVSPKSGNAGETTINISVTDNNDSIPRSGFVYLYIADNRKLEISIIQDATQLSVSPSELNFSPDASSQQIEVAANTSWSLSTEESWIHIDNSAGSGNATISVSVDNNSGELRTGTINLLDKWGNHVDFVTVKQDEESFVVKPYELSFFANGGTEKISIYSNTSWSLSTTANWLEFDKISGNGNTDVLVSASANNLCNERDAEIELKNAADETVQTIHVTQTEFILEASTYSIDIPYTAYTVSVNITSNFDWTVSTDASWVQLSKTSGNGKDSFTVSVDENTGDSPRSADIYIMCSSITKTISIIQQADTEILDYTRDLGHVFASNGESLSVTSFEYDVDWSAEVVEGTQWITLSSAFGRGDEALVITTADNPSGKSRTGEIQITYGYNRYTCKVEQYGKTIDVFPTGSIDFFAKGGKSGSVSITADKTVSISSSANWLTIDQEGNTFSVTAEKNNNKESRSTTLTITLPDVTNSPSVSISVRQAGISSSFTFEGFEEDEKWK